ncbi:hypothetical protein [Mycoplana sp. MJR14]|uniref:hypothetical protein n=1 Tax=Mycoplana sp. MJR14 TaxID=3032583 RepID=UPI000DD617D4|nr:hypothetical protein [Mycoplana sp. MJR14]MDF1632273.1 hypothetical protein [Mycoplana sp. MJR14]
MVQILFLLLVVAVAWLGYRKFVADAERLTRKRRAAERERQNDAIGTLVKDPKTGEYRLRRDDD